MLDEGRLPGPGVGWPDGFLSSVLLFFFPFFILAGGMGTGGVGEPC